MSKNSYSRYGYYLIHSTILLSFVSVSTEALPNDHQAILHISADSSEYHYPARETCFIGHVSVDQGTTHMRAARLVTKKNSNNKIQYAFAYGNKQPVHYWTQPQKDGQWLHAYAKMIQFYPLVAQIVLLGNVNITHHGHRFQGQAIVYNIKKQTITVPSIPTQRATFLIEAEQLNQVL